MRRAVGGSQRWTWPRFTKGRRSRSAKRPWSPASAPRCECTSRARARSIQDHGDEIRKTTVFPQVLCRMPARPRLQRQRSPGRQRPGGGANRSTSWSKSPQEGFTADPTPIPTPAGRGIDRARSRPRKFVRLGPSQSARTPSITARSGLPARRPSAAWAFVSRTGSTKNVEIGDRVAANGCPASVTAARLTPASSRTARRRTRRSWRRA